jgi:hypothetical protein
MTGAHKGNFGPMSSRRGAKTRTGGSYYRLHAVVEDNAVINALGVSSSIFPILSLASWAKLVGIRFKQATSPVVAKYVAAEQPSLKTGGTHGRQFTFCRSSRQNT